MTPMSNGHFDVVALHGLPGAGKDTVADFLVSNYGFRKAAFADALYRQVAESFGVKEEELRSREWKTTPQNLLSARCSDCASYRAVLENHGTDMQAPQTSRFHLRMWAHEYRRMIDPMYWVSELNQTLLQYKSSSIVIPDLRYRHTEAPFLTSFARRTNREFNVIELVADFSEQAGHVSDDRLFDHQITTTIQNVAGKPEVMLGAVQRFLGLPMKAAA